MKKLLLVFLLLFSIIFRTTAQDDFRDERKGKFIFSIGPEYRITPFYNFTAGFSSSNNFSSFTNVDKQNSGTAVNVDVTYFITKNFGIGFSNSFRYDLVISEFSEIQSPLGVNSVDYKFIFDYNLYLTHYFKVFKNSELYL